MMEEQLISFETAKLAKEKGFDENTVYYFDSAGTRRGYLGGKRNNSSLNFWTDGGVKVSAPSQSLLQKWLREVYKINVESNYLPNVSKYGCLYIPMTGKTKLSDIKFVNKLKYNTYEEALEVALQQALKLI